MPMYLPKDCQGNPWDQWENLLARHPKGHKIYAKYQRNTSALIIVWWGKDNSLTPTHFLCSSASMDYDTHPRHYENPSEERDNFVAFGDNKQREDPMQYARLSTVLDKIEMMRRYFNTERIGLILWSHPEAHFVPEEKYIKMQSGHRFEGSPRQ